MLTKDEQKQVINLVYQTKELIFHEMEHAKVTEKGAADFVTNVDLAVQEFLTRELHVLFPEIEMIAEEKENLNLSGDKKYWILDPIDGTTNLIYGFRISSVSLALYEQGEIVMGVVYNPFMDEMFTAAKGEGAFLNGQAIHTTEHVELQNAVISFGSCPYDKSRSKELFEMFERIYVQCADFRRTASAALEFCYVACGRQQGYMELNLKPWDYAAGSLILTEAGGSFGAWKEGEKPTFLENSDVLATNGILEQDIRELQKTLLPENHSNKPIS